MYSQLLLWIDENHDGISQPNEVHHLAELGVYSLGLKYTESPYTDSFGNQFRYKAKVNPLGEPRSDQVDRISYDVFLELYKPVTAELGLDDVAVNGAIKSKVLCIKQ